MERDGRKVVAACGEVGRDRRQIGLSTDLKNEVHANNDVEEEVTMEKPEARVVGSETDNDVAVVRDGNGVLRWWEVSLLKVTLEQTSSIEVESMFQVDLLYVLVR